MADVSVVILTMGDRSTELAAAVGSARAQTGVDVEVVLVVNGGDPDRSLADTVVEPGENLGIPGGRNAGANVATADLRLFLDDDGELVGDAVLRRAATTISEEPDLAVIALRISDEFGNTARRHRSRLGGDPGRSSDVTAFPGGACVVRKPAFDDVGGLCSEFFYGLEETDLAWRLIDSGWRIRYMADLEMFHPRTHPDRHPSFVRGTARNRVWLAHRALPLPLAVLYVIDWTVVTLVRNAPNPAAVWAHLAGLLEGMRDRVGPRGPISWRTALLLTRLGRPPVI